VEDRAELDEVLELMLDLELDVEEIWLLELGLELLLETFVETLLLCEEEVVEVDRLPTNAATSSAEKTVMSLMM